MTTLANYKNPILLLFMLILTVWYMFIKRDELNMSSTNFVEQFSIVETAESGSDNDAGTLILSTVENTQNGKSQTSSTVKSSDSNENAASFIDFRGIFVDLKNIRRSTRNIFFIESRCATEKLAKEVRNVTDVGLNPRQSCAVESAAVTNPSRDVYVLHTCPVGDDFLVKSPEYVRRLLDYPNVRLVWYNMTEMFADTPVEGLVAKKRLEESSFPVEHASDVLRLTMLWKYGGTYCDLDVVAIRSFDDLKTNFCGLESDYTVGSAVLNFEPYGEGHNLLTKALQHVNDHFDGSRWTANGPDLITNMVLEACNATTENLMSCETFTVFNHTVLYPIYWWDHAQLFNSTIGPDIADYVKKSSYIVHVWNKQSNPNKVIVGSTQAYGILANEYCPSVYGNCGESF